MSEFAREREVNTPTHWYIFDPNGGLAGGYRPIKIGPTNYEDEASIFIGDAGGDKSVLAKAALIVRAVNAHQALVEALNGFLLGASSEKELAALVGEDVVREARAALKLAEAKP